MNRSFTLFSFAMSFNQSLRYEFTSLTLEPFHGRVSLPVKRQKADRTCLGHITSIQLGTLFHRISCNRTDTKKSIDISWAYPRNAIASELVSYKLFRGIEDTKGFEGDRVLALAS